jgi:hypothetical protein
MTTPKSGQAYDRVRAVFAGRSDEVEAAPPQRSNVGRTTG